LTRLKVAALAGVSNGCLIRLLYGRDGELSQKVKPDTAAKLLAVQASLDDLSDRALVDAGPTRRRAQALAAIGWSLSEQARRVGCQHKHYSPLLTAPTVTARMARAVRDMYEELSMVPAPAGGSATRTRRMAAARGWLPPLEWNDIDAAEPAPNTVDDPGDVVDEVAVERALAGERVELTDAELVAVLQAGTARGEPLSQLSNRLGINYFGARKMLGGEMTPQRRKRAEVEAELRRNPDRPDSHIAALVGVHHQTVTRARARLAKRHPQLADAS